MIIAIVTAVIVVAIGMFVVLSIDYSEKFTVKNTFEAKKTAEFINEQVSRDKDGNFREYLVFLQSIKSTNRNISKVSTYYYFIELANDGKLKSSNVLTKM